MSLRPRAPAVAGRFYPGTAEGVRDVAQRLVSSTAAPEPAIAIVAPHAGWIYSGEIAGRTWAAVEVPPKVIVLCPNHTGRGVRRSLWPGGAWQLPSGEVEVDEPLCEAIAEHCGLTRDREAHEREHAIEVHLPLLQARRPDVRIAAICLAGLSLAECEMIGVGLADVVQASAEPVLLVASTDMSHFLAADVAADLDTKALRAVLDLDPEVLVHTVRAHAISMCGVLATAVTLFAALRLGATRARLLQYGNSGETSGDYDRVVGYAGVVVSAAAR